MADEKRTLEEWPHAMAEVTQCQYDVRAGRALAFGLTSKKHFRIAYSYRAGNELHTGECFSDIARPQGSLFEIRYNPNEPHINRFDSGRSQPVPMLAIGIAGSIVLTLLWLLVLRGCS